MNKIFQILILIGFFITFAAFEIYQSTGNKVIKIITPSKLAIDFNINNRADINELVCVENLETLTSDIKLDQRKIQNQLLLSNIDVIKFVYITDKFAKEVSSLTGLPVKMTTVKADIFPALKDKLNNLMPIDLYVRQSWLRKEV